MKTVFILLQVFLISTWANPKPSRTSVCFCPANICETCETKNCSSGQKCELQQQECPAPTPPCYCPRCCKTVAVCVSCPASETTCPPRPTCDGYCPDDQKCELRPVPCPLPPPGTPNCCGDLPTCVDVDSTTSNPY